MKVKKYTDKFLTVVLSLSFTMGVFSACDNDKQEAVIPQLPDYSKTEGQIDFFAYSPPGDGTYSVDGIIKELGTNKMTLEGYTTYREAGFDIIMLTQQAKYNGEDWNTSACKRAWELALEAGIDRVLVNDNRLEGLISYMDKLVGETSDCRFSTEDELNEYVKQCVSTFKDMEGFYGFKLHDEPVCAYTGSIGKVYRAIKKAGEDLGLGDLYIHMNLLPLGGKDAPDYSKTAENLTDAYYDYVRGFLEATGADRLSCDVYLYRGTGIANGFYQSAQIMKQCCDEYGAELTFCLQSFEVYNGSTHLFRGVGRSEMFGEFYSLLGMGVDNFAYYTYQIPYILNTKTPYIDESSFITPNGEKTNVYYYGQQVMETADKMEDIILNYEYQGGKFYTATLASFDNSRYLSTLPDAISKTAVDFDNSYEFKLLQKVDFDNDIVFATELYDEDNQLYMYMLQNAIDPINSELGRTAEKITATFSSEYTYVAELHEGNLQYVALKNGVYEKVLSAGDAVYIIPLK